MKYKVKPNEIYPHNGVHYYEGQEFETEEKIVSDKVSRIVSPKPKTEETKKEGEAHV